jgi:hypothetical protein
MAPHSDRVARLAGSVIESRLSEQGATRLTSGDEEGRPTEECRTPYDLLGGLAAWFGEDTIGETKKDEEEMQEVLSDRRSPFRSRRLAL